MSLRFALLALLALATPACSVDLGTSSEGELGRARFAYSSCFFGCAIDHPVLAGGTARISVQGEDLPEITATSSDASILTVSATHSYACCRSTGNSSECASSTKEAVCDEGFTKSVSQSLRVVGHHAGSARVSLLDASGATVDAITLEVSRPATARLRLYYEESRRDVTSIELTRDGSESLAAILEDAAGRPLESDGGVTLEVDDPAIASFDSPAWFSAESAGVRAVEQGALLGLPRLRGRAPGTTTLHVRSGDFRHDFVVTVK